jgi:hypothetical protein
MGKHAKPRGSCPAACAMRVASSPGGAEPLASGFTARGRRPDARKAEAKQAVSTVLPTSVSVPLMKKPFTR